MPQSVALIGHQAVVRWINIPARRKEVHKWRHIRDVQSRVGTYLEAVTGHINTPENWQLPPDNARSIPEWDGVVYNI